VLLLLQMIFETLTDQLLDLHASALGPAPASFAMVALCCSCCCCMEQGSGDR
jgi:hypothetical protein